MAYIIAEPCINVKDTACVEVCPVDCIPNDPNHVESRDDLYVKYLHLVKKAG